ncbi:hypothetical protein ADEAN_000180700 [Angomonas deanei]|uniref:Uncharacterized protein n=1 Tax=Angomonas deanei TaxID=59799 RepID=A0A7G2C8M3_9TRYP|nr:hypothetical protein ADEAN_000180700 [Angomonas deanei]
MLIALLSRRVVHGDLRTTEGLFLLEHNNSDTNNNNNSAVLCFHWENFMDFNVFVDRNVGRSIYYQTESVVNGDVVSSLLFHGKDVETLLEYFLLEHATHDEKEETTEGDAQKKTKFTTRLNTNQYFQLNKLLSLTREQTQMINYILVINNCLKSIPSL